MGGITAQQRRRVAGNTAGVRAVSQLPRDLRDTLVRGFSGSVPESNTPPPRVRCTSAAQQHRLVPSLTHRLRLSVDLLGLRESRGSPAKEPLIGQPAHQAFAVRRGRLRAETAG